jgi:hypothetical protein
MWGELELRSDIEIMNTNQIDHAQLQGNLLELILGYLAAGHWPVIVRFLPPSVKIQFILYYSVG